MKKSILSVFSLILLLGLASCGDSSSISASSSISNEESSLPSSSKEDSSVSSSSSTPSSDLEWNAEDLTDMKKAFLNDSLVIPFPTSMTSNYTNASYIDENYNDQYTFYVSDNTIKDISESYAAQLTPLGFVSDETFHTEYPDTYLYILKDMTKKIEFSVQIGYNTAYTCFEIYAFAESIEGQYEGTEFPYTQMETFLSITDAANKVPSFVSSLYNGIENDTAYVISGASDTALETSYTATLQTKGYTIDTTQYEEVGNIAINETFGLKIIYFDTQMTEGYVFAMSVEKYVPVPEGTNSITLNQDTAGIPTNYGETTFTVDSITFKCDFVLANKGYSYIQFKSNKSSEFPYLLNTSTLYAINSIVVTGDTNTQYYSPLTLYVGATSDAVTTKIEPTVSGVIYTYSVTGSYGFMKLVNEGTTYASKNPSIVINYTK